MGINRNIVECKYFYGEMLYNLQCVLIETLWNVNEYEGLKDDKGSGSINRNIVECKLRQNSSTKLSAIVY